MTTFLFFLAGFLLLFAIYALGFDHPFGSKSWMDDFWWIALTFASGIGGGVLLWVLLAKNPMNWIFFLALIIPMVLVAAIMTWRIWSQKELFLPILVGITPFILLAIYAYRKGLPEATGISLLIPSLAIVSGAAWYLAAWKDPRWNISIKDFLSIGESTGKVQEIAANLDLGEDKKTLEKGATIALTARKVRPVHLKVIAPRGILLLAAIVISVLLWQLSPRYGWLGIIAGPVGMVPSLIYWWRGRDLREIRTLLLGLGALIYDGIALLTVIFFLLQMIWVFVAINAVSL